MEQKRALVIGGPTGVGENTVVAEIRKRYPDFVRLTTATTREPRLGEKDKTDYYFFSNDEFLKEVENGNIPEYQNSRDKKVYYGTYLPDLEKKISKGYSIIITPDITGARYFKKHYGATTIFLLPDSMENLEKRHLKRDPSITEKELAQRLEYARREIENEADFYDYKVMNAQDKLDETVDSIVKILKKENYPAISES